MEDGQQALTGMPKPIPRHGGRYKRLYFYITIFGIASVLLLVGILIHKVPWKRRLRNPGDGISTIENAVEGANLLHADGTQVVTCAKDLGLIQPTDGTIRVKSLSNDDEVSAQSIHALQVNSIEIYGPVSSYWLSFLGSTFTGASNLTVNVDAVCLGTSDSEFILKFPNVINLKLTNFADCDSSKFMWKFDKMMTLEVEDSSFSKEGFRFFHNFLEQYKDQLKRVSIIAKYRCSSCHFTDIDFPRGTKRRFENSLA